MRTFHTGGVARADITTGLPRVEELFEARAPKGAAVLADREGVVSIEQTDTGRMLAITVDRRRAAGLSAGARAGMPALADGDMVIKDKTVHRRRSGRPKKLYSAIDGTFFVDGRTIYVRNEKEERDEYSVPVVVPDLCRGRRSRVPGSAADRRRQGSAARSC